MSYLSYGAGLAEIRVTIRTPDGQSANYPVYAVCDRVKEAEKRFARRHYREHLKPNWHCFIADASAAAGVKSFLKGCRRH